MLEVSEREEGIVALHLPIVSLKIPLLDGAVAEMRTQYLPTH